MRPSASSHRPDAVAESRRARYRRGNPGQILDCRQPGRDGACEAVARPRELAQLPIVATGTSALIHDAWQLRNRITVYDACYVTLARRIGGPLVTGDDHLVRTLAGRRDRVLALAAVES